MESIPEKLQYNKIMFKCVCRKIGNNYSLV